MEDEDREVELSGGNASGRVVRVGGTVRKPWLPSTPRVAEYLRHLRGAGLEVPAPLGRDDHGRQVLEHVPGQLALGMPPLSLDALRRVGALVRRIHDASPPATSTEGWDVLLPPPDGRVDLICHNDLAPWNLVIGERLVFIDWDGAGPSTRLWDLAYAAQTFAIPDDRTTVPEAATRLRAVVDGHGADADLRAGLPRALARRTGAMRDLLADAHEAGRQPWARMHVEGHGEHWRAVTAFVERHRAAWADALA